VGIILDTHDLLGIKIFTGKERSVANVVDFGVREKKKRNNR
jgi:hypothetical protein